MGWGGWRYTARAASKASSESVDGRWAAALLLVGSGVVGAAESVCCVELAERAASASERVFGVSWEGVPAPKGASEERAERVERKGRCAELSPIVVGLSGGGGGGGVDVGVSEYLLL